MPLRTRRLARIQGQNRQSQARSGTLSRPLSGADVAAAQFAVRGLYLVIVTSELNANLKYELSSSNRCDSAAVSSEGVPIPPFDRGLLPRCYADRHAVQ